MTSVALRFRRSGVGALLLIITSVLLVTVVKANNDFHCDEVWPENTTKNSVEQCLNNRTHLGRLMAKSDHVGWVFMMCLLAAFAIGAWITCPFFMIGRYCCNCCGSRHRRPGHFCCGGEEWDHKTKEEKDAGYSRVAVLNTKIAAVVLLFLGIIFFITLLTGVSVAHEKYNEFYDQAFGIVDYVDFQEQNLRRMFTRNDTGDFINGITNQVFDRINDTKTSLRTQISNAKDTTDTYLHNFSITGWVLAIVPIVLFVTTVICAICHIRVVLPVINLGCHCFWTVPYAFVSIVFLIFAVAVRDVCVEREKFLADTDEPGLVSYGLQPTCKRYLPLDDIRDRINNAIRENAQLACKQVLQLCNGDPNFSFNDPTKVYFCEVLARLGPNECQTFQRARELIEAATPKPNGILECRTDLNDPATAYDLKNCTIPNCATDCTNKQLREEAAVVVTAADYVGAAEAAYRTFGEPWLYCSALLIQALGPLAACEEVKSGFTAAGVGFWLMTLMLVVGMVVVALGQKRFFKKAPHESPLSSVSKRQPLKTY